MPKKAQSPDDASNNHSANAYDYGFIMEAYGREFHPLPQKYIKAVVEIYNESCLPIKDEEEVELSFEEYIKIKHRVHKYYYLAVFILIYA